MGNKGNSMKELKNFLKFMVDFFYFHDTFEYISNVMSEIGKEIFNLMDRDLVKEKSDISVTYKLNNGEDVSHTKFFVHRINIFFQLFNR